MWATSTSSDKTGHPTRNFQTNTLSNSILKLTIMHLPSAETVLFHMWPSFLWPKERMQFQTSLSSNHLLFAFSAPHQKKNEVSFTEFSHILLKWQCIFVKYCIRTLLQVHHLPISGKCYCHFSREGCGNVAISMLWIFFNATMTKKALPTMML